MNTVGIDEVGRGCWAGPLVAAAVMLDGQLDGLQDSKIISKKNRERLEAAIIENATAFGIGWVWPREIDDNGLTWAVKTAMERALLSIQEPFDEVIIDGNINYLHAIPHSRAIIKADNHIPAVSAASIIAKVARDRYMETTAHNTFPQYEFESHVGYGTKRHIELLKQFGASPEHRYCYKPIKAIQEQEA